MTSGPDGAIEAAGGLLWRGYGDALEVALVHRPKYDDWSVPKGKLDQGETPLAAAVREVAEETGLTGVPGRPLGEHWYEQEGRPKRARYWAMTPTGGGFAPSEEVDQLAWCSPDRARGLVTADRDGSVLDAFLADPVPTCPLVVLRHASAGRRRDWPGEDGERPLDAHGRLQADVLARDLALYGPLESWSAGVRRCLQSLPLASDVRVQPLLEAGADPARALQWLQALAAARRPAVVCTQRGPLPGVVEELVASLGGPLLDLPLPAKAARVILHLARDPGLRLVAVEHADPPL